MSARKGGKAFGLTQLRAPQPRAEPPDVLDIGEQRLAGAFEVAIEQVVPDPDQPRRDWSYDGGDQRLLELADSIREFGIFQPLVVREDGALPDRRTRYVVIAGGRRRAAAELANVRTLPILIRGEEGARLRVMQLIENLQRQELSPLDEARAYQELLDAETMTPPQLANRVHKSAQHIRTRLRILADQVIADAIARRQVPVSAAGIIQQLPDEEVLTFKERLRAGETLHMADVLGVRDRLRANGATNPRSKGGGRLRESGHYPAGATANPIAAAEAFNQTETTPEQKVFVPVQGEQEPAPELPQPVVDLDHGVENHPAARRAVGRAVGELIRRHLPTEVRQQVESRLGQLAAQGDDASWLPALYHGLLGTHEPQSEESCAEHRERSRHQGQSVAAP
ncbi:MAG TPA: ParB/RepB/Spo0J family partition protein [Thermomicrobiales bacterium]|jgi:ParB/RepB/Spo0J family partition protein